MYVQLTTQVQDERVCHVLQYESILCDFTYVIYLGAEACKSPQHC